ncbi:hypothetical protein l11_10170 [Neisseria weaveri LMG 5135]|nr:hypothetical protein l13_14930 [Neisseria weaveri ATCC 51223]EGV37776.1 hypothetical protein l11_10170 [Neisseria weaveri LMG 5135]
MCVFYLILTAVCLHLLNNFRRHKFMWENAWFVFQDGMLRAFRNLPIA